MQQFAITAAKSFLLSPIYTATAGVVETWLSWLAAVTLTSDCSQLTPRLFIDRYDQYLIGSPMTWDSAEDVENSAEWRRRCLQDVILALCIVVWFFIFAPGCRKKYADIHFLWYFRNFLWCFRCVQHTTEICKQNLMNIC